MFAIQAEPGEWVANGGGLSAQYNSARQRKLAKKAHMQLLFEADIQHIQDKVYTLVGELRFAEGNIIFAHAITCCGLAMRAVSASPI